MTASMTIRPAQQDDAPVLARLIDMAGEGIPRFLWTGNPEGLEPLDWGARRAARDEGGFSYRNASVAVIDDAVAGMLLGYRQPDPYDVGDLDEVPAVVRSLIELEARAPGSWYVNALAALPEYRGQGVGTALLDEAERLAMETGAPALSLIASEENAGAVRLYENTGYRSCDRCPITDYPGAPYGGDWLLMVKPLTGFKRD